MKALIVILVVLVLVGVSALLSGLFWMLGLGAFSHIFNEPKFAIDYWHSVLVAFIVNLLIGGMFKRSTK